MVKIGVLLTPKISRKILEKMLVRAEDRISVKEKSSGVKKEKHFDKFGTSGFRDFAGAEERHWKLAQRQRQTSD